MTSTITLNGAYATAATQARQATEKTANVSLKNVKAFTNWFDNVKLPSVDLTESVNRYFAYLQMTVDFNRDLATQWAEMVTTLSGTVREQAQQVSGIVAVQADKVADLAVKQAEKAEKVAEDAAEKVEEAERAQAEEAVKAEKAEAREAKRGEREEAKKAEEKAREAYDGLTKTELSDQLAERGLPKTGNVEDLIERLVSADTE